MTRRRSGLSDFSIPLGLIGLACVAVLWGWRVAVIIALAAGTMGAAGIAVLSPWRGRLRGTTMEVGDRPLLVHLYSPY